MKDYRKYTKRHLRKRTNVYKILFWILVITIIIYLLSKIDISTKLEEALSSDIVKISSQQLCVDNEFNTIMCKTTCGLNNLNYQTYKCVKGEAICHCKK